MFQESCAHIDELTDDVSCYVSYCVDNIIPDRSVKVYPNNKPLITKSLKGLLKERQHAFQKGNVSEFNQLKKKKRSEIGDK